MRRPAHGGTTRPGPCRPASGFGRLAGRPGPATVAVARDDNEAGVLRDAGHDAVCTESVTPAMPRDATPFDTAVS